MRKLILAAGVATLAITVPAAAKPDHAGGGKGGGKGGETAQVKRGGGGQKAARADRGGQARVQKAARRGGSEQRIERRGGGMRFAAFQSERGGGKADRTERRGGGKADRVETRGRGKSDGARVRVAQQRQDVRGRDRIELRGDRGHGRRDQQRIVRVERDRDLVKVKGRDRDVVFARDFDEDRWERIFGNRGLPRGFVGGCPPGLEKKIPRCVPPGQAKNLVGTVLPTAFRSNVLPLGLRDVWRDDDDFYYRYGDGYLYRVDRDTQLVNSLLPLIGAGLGIGQPFPYMGSNYAVPSYYQPFYQNYGDDYYRYANGYVYEVDGRTGLIEDMIPLLDRGYGVGQMLPSSYSYYNVPYQYRSTYYDTPDYFYRYAPGAIYQVDRDTQLITAIASLLTGGLSVGQPLPSAYSMYNVPMGYRSMYYDTPDAWYRYNDGYIYQVDPTSQLITAIVRAIV